MESHASDDFHRINPRFFEVVNGDRHFFEEHILYIDHKNPRSLDGIIAKSPLGLEYECEFAALDNGDQNNAGSSGQNLYEREFAALNNGDQNNVSSSGQNLLGLEYKREFAALDNGDLNKAGSSGQNLLSLEWKRELAALSNGDLKNVGSSGVSGNKRYPPGFRFCPHDHELIERYLKPKIGNPLLNWDHIKEVDLYKNHPDALTEQGCEGYFFTPRDRKYPNGSRPNRVITDAGYWKATGADRDIVFQGKIIGKMKALVFYEEDKSQIRHENGKEKRRKNRKEIEMVCRKTNWIMHEYRVYDPTSSKHESTSKRRRDDNHMRLDDYVLCKISKTGRSFKIQEHEGSSGGQATSTIESCNSDRLESCNVKDEVASA